MFGASCMTSPGRGARRTAALIAMSLAGLMGGGLPAVAAPAAFGEEGSDVDASRSPHATGLSAFALGSSAACVGFWARDAGHASRCSRGWGTTSRRLCW
jgi:hypothetical protein